MARKISFNMNIFINSFFNAYNSFMKIVIIYFETFNYLRSIHSDEWGSINHINDFLFS